MKQNLKRWWRFTNVGHPDATQDGEGNGLDFLKAAAQYWIDADMGKRVVLTIYRNAADREQGNAERDKNESTEAALDQMWANLGFDAELIEEESDGPQA